jgi:hypothetical protein
VLLELVRHSPFDERQAGVRGQCPKAWALVAPARERNSSRSVIVPADGTRTANGGTGNFGSPPIFVQSSDKPLLVSICLFVVPECKAQWQIEKLCANPIR